MVAIEKLLEVSGPSLRSLAPSRGQLSGEVHAYSVAPLLSLLGRRNGFYAFQRALRVFPDQDDGGECGLVKWNRPATWRDRYEGMADRGVFFAEDVFGTQFGLCPDGVVTFDPETADYELVAASMEEWAALLLADPAYWTGHPVAAAWQRANRPLCAGERLSPVTPFVLGGAFDAANLRAIEATEGMRFRASIATRIRDLPDGAQVELRVVP